MMQPWLQLILPQPHRHPIHLPLRLKQMTERQLALKLQRVQPRQPLLHWTLAQTPLMTFGSPPQTLGSPQPHTMTTILPPLLPLRRVSPHLIHPVPHQLFPLLSVPRPLPVPHPLLHHQTTIRMDGVSSLSFYSESLALCRVALYFG